MQRRSLILFATTLAALALLIAFTAPNLVAKTRFGLEFRGGYEILYVAEAQADGQPVTPEKMLKAANLLRSRADGIGMAEPEISLEGKNRIRLKVAGLTSAEQFRSVLGNASGMPVKLTEKYTQSVGSVLGKAALKDTLTAGAIGTALIFLLLIGLYRIAGLVASFCLVVYLWLMLVVFNALSATLSLSAIVAFVLGIGVAADATIIGFERIKEEFLKSGRFTSAFNDGFHSAWRTIRDANSVTAIAMAVLFLAGIGPIQGFSLTMLISMVISVATNVFLVHFLCVKLSESEVLPPAALLCGSGAPKVQPGHAFNYVGIGLKSVVLSIIIMISGAWYYSKHGLNLDIDFTAGTALDIDLEKTIDADTATNIMTEAGIVPATASVGGEGNKHIAARFDEILKPEELNKIITAFKAKYVKVDYEENTADPGVAREFATKAIYALLAAAASIVIYIGLRFSWPIAFATLIAIAHDLLLVSAIFALFKLEIDVTYIAAMLTIMGYSLNDKIVIFDRIRENLKTGAQGDFLGRDGAKVLANRSIGQTLGRSIFTVLTVVLASISLYYFGCEPLQMFALAILLGLISGAYSSIFLACPLWIVMRVSRRVDAPVRL